jgi:hypothetical protein
MTIKEQMNEEDRSLVDAWLSKNKVTQIPIGKTTIKNNIPRKAEMGKKEKDKSGKRNYCSIRQ